MYRYVCPHCLRTFLDEEYNEEKFCWKCGQGLEIIPEKENLIDHGYICSECARKLGAKFPSNHHCAWSDGECDVCNQTNGLCHTSDWNWPEELKHLEEDREI